MSEKYFIDFEKVIPHLLTKDALQKVRETAEKINELKFDYYKSREITLKDLMHVINL